MESKITVLRDNPELCGKKFFLVSMISPDSTQKHNVHGFKIHDMCENEDEGKKLCEYYHKLDDDFDVYLGTVGKWLPWSFDPTQIPNAQYADDRLTDLIKGHREQKLKSNEEWEKEFENSKEKIMYEGSKKGQEERSKLNETPQAILFKISQIENVINTRTAELEKLKSFYVENYSEDERKQAESLEIPISQVAPMQYVDAPTPV